MMDDPFIFKEQGPPKLVDQVSGQFLESHFVHLKDPLTNKTLVKLHNPKLAIKGYTNQGEKCVNLSKDMCEKCVTPDFGFDIAEI